MKIKWTLALASVGALAAFGVIALAGTSHKDGLVVHEWGTFTSFQGGDGVLLNWKPLVTSSLPGFVYDWSHAGLNRFHYNGPVQGPDGQYYFSKGSMVTLQRMETPVVYFYSDKALTADISVRFPKGLITEWYPQACEIGPSYVPPSKRLTSLDSSIHKCGVSPKVSLASSFSEKPLTNSLVHWSKIRILPPDFATPTPLPSDTNGSHYFAARETDANVIQMDSLSATNPGPQYEKFLFYRGAGSFTTPLLVTMKSDDAITLTNTGREPLHHLFVLDVKNKSGAFIYVDQLLPGHEKTVVRPATGSFLPPDDLISTISKDMSQALIKEGLYPREAAAMVNTWKSSWFAEDGTRVFYVLPRAWADQTLPMSLNPQPRELTRVMVGRAEIFSPDSERNLAQQLEKARTGDAAAIAQVHQMAETLGRFGEPAFYRTLGTMNKPFPEQSQLSALFFGRKQTGAGSDFE